MRGRLALLTGFAAGYVLGAKAGTQRYEEIRAQFNKLMGTEPAQQLQAEVKVAASKAGSVIEEKATEGITKVSELVGSGGSSSSSSSTTGGTDSAAGGTSGIVLPPT